MIEHVKNLTPYSLKKKLANPDVNGLEKVFRDELSNLPDNLNFWSSVVNEVYKSDLFAKDAEKGSFERLIGLMKHYNIKYLNYSSLFYKVSCSAFIKGNSKDIENYLNVLQSKKIALPILPQDYKTEIIKKIFKFGEIDKFGYLITEELIIPKTNDINMGKKWLNILTKYEFKNEQIKQDLKIMKKYNLVNPQILNEQIKELIEENNPNLSNFLKGLCGSYNLEMNVSEIHVNH
ncbi:MAG: hypothetical protein WC393_05270 [Candidatus Nanoarchaeia archaeon]|jgi:hypothetical protein